MDPARFSVRHGRSRWMPLAAVGALALVAALPTATSADQSSSPAGGSGFTPTRTGGIPGSLLPSELSLWQWDPATSKYVVAEGDASQPYVPTLRAAPAGTKIGYAEGWAAIPFSASINKGIYANAAQVGAEIAYCDIDFKEEKAVSCAELISQQQPTFVINSNWQAPAAAAVMAVYDGAGIPTTSIDVIHPNAIFMGADNYTSGEIGGKAAGAYAQSLGRCGDVTIFLGENPAEGAAADQRLVGFADGVQEVCGAIPADRIKRDLFDAGTGDQALTKATDWLTANPTAGFVLSTSIDDARADGVAKALTQSNREGAAVGLGCDEIGQASTKAATPDKNRFLGCVAYFPERYPDYVMSIALDVIEGKAVPQEVHIEHQFLDHQTIGSVYP